MRCSLSTKPIKNPILKIILGESIYKSQSNGFIEPGKKPPGILKNKSVPEVPRKGDSSGYIKRNTVQRILDQQKKVCIPNTQWCFWPINILVYLFSLGYNATN